MRGSTNGWKQENETDGNEHKKPEHKIDFCFFRRPISIKENRIFFDN